MQQTDFRALTIAGSDSGGGAGIQADIKTFQELGVYGMSAITAVTAQNSLGVHHIHPIPLTIIEQQLHAIGSDMNPAAVKTGMLVDAATIELVATMSKRFRWNNVVVDPVMIAKGGASLLQQTALQALIQHLLPITTVITPNIPEAEILTGLTINTLKDREKAASNFVQMGVTHVLIKGGHDETNTEHSVDLYYDGQSFHYLSGQRVATKHTHGTGCTLSAAITAQLARQKKPLEAIHKAKKFIQAAIEHAYPIGAGHGPTNHFAYNQMKNKRKTATGNHIQHL
ncbi:bifunctional hydroxymethylpyrimidine kinase/phosphomethylpyrimidine kinase [Paenibacillus yanchengensis]|uniref:Hydroxymethylpyrimidine/phosphomethylpyrimidine kinase n=1 Tax=Paenibacillus yanchengensis TaxID=2035833 RepID=A0ABW4YHC1_9BACL